MSEKDKLARDIARLFVKYDLKTWSDLLKTLSTDEFAASEIRTHIEQFAQAARRHKPKANRLRSESIKKKLEALEPEKARPLFNLYQSLRDKELFPKMQHLREFAFAIGMKESLPSKRDQSIRLIVEHLSSLGVELMLERLKHAVSRQTDFDKDYESWFKIIYGGPSAMPSGDNKSSADVDFE